ncbi:hypothetical protein JI664_23180 [Rhodobacter sp. NTK016B]|uniref:hypothetical protein n=1 Tax=Rhodobacter sp. NTK016B TaxID=2759676 RepID=UPI001A8C469F|nr:hypothetical protein [Rhodobacter sp. NTK016B]MBN8294893.1 hypothetical protein [Rhodobacter sp. NTK016B]
MRPMIALSILIFSASCGDSALDRLRAAETRRVQAEARELPEFPEWCRQEHQTPVAVGDPLDVALARVAADRRAYRDQVRACVGWYNVARSIVAR